MLIKAKSLLFVLLIGAFQQASAQNLTRSPYSAIGLGEIQFSGSAWMSAMGQTGQGISASTLINNQNPASYNALQFTVFDIGANGSTGKFQTNAGSDKVSTASYGYFALAFPLSQKLRWGSSLGFMPYSSVGYNTSKTAVTATFTGTETLTGTGGLTQFYLGSGIKVYKQLSAGINAKYIFGSQNTSLFLNIPAEYLMFNLAEERERYINGFIYDIGLQYTDTFSRNNNRYKWGAGLTVTPQMELNASDDYNVRTLPVGSTSPISGGGFGKDTIVNESGVKGKVTLPMMIKGGIHWQKVDAWGVNIDLGFYNWESYRVFGRNDSLKNTLSVGIGGSIIPDAAALKGYLNRVEYRAGFRFDNGNIRVNETNINSYSVSAGLGLPLGRSRSKLNLTAEYMVRGTKSNNLLREEYFRFTVGVLISDRWFHRYRYD